MVAVMYLKIVLLRMRRYRKHSDFAAHVRKVQLSGLLFHKLIKMVNALDLEYEVFIDFRSDGSVVAKEQRNNLR